MSDKLKEFSQEAVDAIDTRMHKAWELVRPTEDWKAPVDAYVTSNEVKDVYEAVIYFTATTPTVEYVGVMSSSMNSPKFARFKKGDHICRVKAIGYRNGPAGDH
jgi:hypothetical protein